MLPSRVLFLVAILAALAAFPGPRGTASDQASLAKLRAEVQQLQQEADRAEAALADAKGRLALAEGRKQQAAAEFGKLVRYREAQLRDLIARSGRICEQRPFTVAHGELAVARVRIAEAEDKLDRLAGLLPDVVAYHQGSIAFVERLLNARAIDPEEARKELRQLRSELQKARDRLDEIRGQLRHKPD
jgi:hypothetical protein